MKKLLLILVAITSALMADAQIVLRNTNLSQAIVRRATTSDNTPKTMETIAIDDDEAGILTIRTLGMDSASAAFITGVKHYRYKKDGGTLTLGSALINSSDTTVADGAISTATFAAAASNNNILVQVTGVTDKTIYWRVIVQRFSLSKEDD